MLHSGEGGKEGRREGGGGRDMYAEEESGTVGSTEEEREGGVQSTHTHTYIYKHRPKHTH